MRKFFSFRSSASSSANSNPTPAVPPSSSKENIYWETPRQNDGKYPVGEKIQDVSQMLDDSAFKPVNRYPECEVIPHSHHRSLSFCSAIHSSTGEGNLYYLSNLSGSPSTCGSSPCHVTKCHAHFDKIIKKEIPSTVVFEDDKVLAFRDISPQAPTHIIIIPKVKDGLSQLSKAEERHIEILGYLLYVAKLVAKQEGLDDGFRIVINDGPKGCQSVYHIHVHLLGGRQMNWPPG